MAKEKGYTEAPDPTEDAKQAASHLVSSIGPPQKGESMADYWKRMAPVALQATMIRALHGDHAASATMFEMVKAPVVEGAKAQVQLTQFSDRNGKSNRLTQTLTAPVSEAQVLLARGGISTAQGPSR